MRGPCVTSDGAWVGGLLVAEEWVLEWRAAWAEIGYHAGLRLMAEGTARRLLQVEDDRARVLHLEGQLAALRGRR
jgi:hypothetical protein